ncbi:hypothetical protein B1R94_22180 [Mycolicibacterium litorale]|nr:hypothetical protein B1R94_22180 [Mycolicibacterium litorale]
MDDPILRRLTGAPVDEPDPAEERRAALRELAEWNRYLNSGQYDADKEAQREAEAETQRTRKLTVAQLLGETLNEANGPDSVPLNGAGIVRAALQGLGRATDNDG